MTHSAAPNCPNNPSHPVRRMDASEASVPHLITYSHQTDFPTRIGTGAPQEAPPWWCDWCGCQVAPTA